MEGTVKFYNANKGYGFIIPDGGGQDVFVHGRALTHSGIDGLRDGQRVRFETEEDERGRGTQAAKLAVGV
jgi:CspA family cold shock protein